MYTTNTDAAFAMIYSGKKLRFSLWDEDQYIYWDETDFCFKDNLGFFYAEELGDFYYIDHHLFWEEVDDFEEVDERDTIIPEENKEILSKKDMFVEGMEFVYCDPDSSIFNKYIVYFVDDFVVYCRDQYDEPFFINKVYLDRYIPYLFFNF